VPPSVPSAAELLEAVRAFLAADVLPALADDRRFQCRVAINALAIVQRELELGAEVAGREGERLAALLGPGAAGRPLAALNAELARRIRTGEMDVADPDLLAHLRETVAEALRINNPRWLDGR
jgi:hypothetical protein